MDDKQKLLEQLALAKEAGTGAMAKEFFAPTPGGDESEAAPAPDDGGGVSVQAEGDITPEQLEELMRALGVEGGGQ